MVGKKRKEKKAEEKKAENENNLSFRRFEICRQRIWR